MANRAYESGAMAFAALVIFASAPNQNVPLSVVAKKVDPDGYLDSALSPDVRNLRESMSKGFLAGSSSVTAREPFEMTPLHTVSRIVEDIEVDLWLPNCRKVVRSVPALLGEHRKHPQTIEPVESDLWLFAD